MAWGGGTTLLGEIAHKLYQNLLQKHNLCSNGVPKLNVFSLPACWSVKLNNWFCSSLLERSINCSFMDIVCQYGALEGSQVAIWYRSGNIADKIFLKYFALASGNNSTLTLLVERSQVAVWDRRDNRKAESAVQCVCEIQLKCLCLNVKICKTRTTCKKTGDLSKTSSRSISSFFPQSIPSAFYQFLPHNGKLSQPARQACKASIFTSILVEI